MVSFSLAQLTKTKKRTGSSEPTEPNVHYQQLPAEPEVSHN
jgi:hypothetical protein